MDLSSSLNYNNIAVIIDPLEPQIIDASYDQESDVLTLIFNRDLNDASFDANASIGLSTDDGSVNTLTITTPMTDMSSLNDEKLQIQLTGGDASTLEAWPNLGVNLEIDYPSSWVQSQSSFFNVAKTFANNVDVTYVHSSPLLLSAKYNEHRDELTLQLIVL